MFFYISFLQTEDPSVTGSQSHQLGLLKEKEKPWKDSLQSTGGDIKVNMVLRCEPGEWEMRQEFIRIMSPFRGRIRARTL